jgi:hypothetical protein
MTNSEQTSSTADAHWFAGLGRSDAVFFGAVFIFAFTQLFSLPFTPFYFEGDHIITATNAMRMAGGEVMYRDLFHMTAPGAELILQALYSIFGVKVFLLNGVIVMLALIQAWLLWYFARGVLTGWLVYLPAAIYFVIGFRAFGIDGSHRLYSVALVLLAVAAVYQRRTARNLLIAGVLCGFACFFVQTRGFVAIAGIALFLFWDNLRKGIDLKRLVVSEAWLALPFLAVLFITHGYLIWQAGFENYYFSMVEFLYRYYPNDPLARSSAYLSELPSLSDYLTTYGTTAGISRFIRVSLPLVFCYSLIPFVYLVYFIYRRRAKVADSTDTRLLLLGFVGMTLSIGVSAPTAFRLGHVAIPGVVILVFLLARFRPAALLLKPAFALLVVVGAAYVVQRQMAEEFILDMPAGRAAFLDKPTYERYAWVGEHTRPGNYVFEAKHPSFYFPFHLKDPSRLYLVRDTNFTPPFQIAELIVSLQKHRPELIIWEGSWSKLPEERAPGDNLAPLWDFVQQNYRLTAEFGDAGDRTKNSVRDSEMWVRVDR